MKKYGVMVIGCGHIGCEHLSDIYFRNDIRICAVIDTDEKAAVTAARKFGAEKYGTDYREFLSSPDIDIVIAATYVHSHYEIVKACIEHGKHVLCEKPVATTADEGKKFFDLVRGASVKVQVAYILRHNKTYQKAFELIQNGAIGELRAIRMAHNHNADNWHRFYNLLSDCMPVVDCGVHYFDVASWFTGSDITEISGMGALLDDDAPKLNYNIVNFKTASGCSCVYEAAWGRNVASRNLKEFIGATGRIELRFSALRGDSFTEGDLISIYRSSTDSYESINVKSNYKDMYAQLKSLIKSIEEDFETTPSISAVEKSFNAAIAAEKSILTGNRVLLS